MKLNLLIDVNESLRKGPGRRALNLQRGLERIGIPFEICSEDYEWAVGIQCGKVFNRVDKMPPYTLIGPNVMHCADDHTIIAAKFINYLVQSEWVADYWRWHAKEHGNGNAAEFNFYVYPASVDLEDGYAEVARTRKPEKKRCMFYTKYQSSENLNAGESICRSRGHAMTRIVYGEYSHEDLLKACAESEYAIYNSCCEKSSNAMMEILACGIPVYVIDSKRWIGDDRFDRCTSAPHFSDACGMKGNFEGQDFDMFYRGVQQGQYDPHKFVAENYTVEKVAADLVEVVKKCHG